jgi:radical SAM protein with 4Fe4S-binding SPASM domain
MSDDLYRKILDELSEEPGVAKIVLSFQNEPFVDESLIEKAKLFKKCVPGKQLEVVTNGSCITKHNIDEIYKYTDMISLSVNALTSETYEDVMQGLHYKDIAGVLELICENREYVEKTVLRFIKQKRNIHEYRDFKRKYNKLGFKVFSFDVNSRLGAVADYADLKIPLTLRKRVELAFLKTVGSLLVKGCPIPRISFYIRANGDSVLCFNDWSEKFALGNVNNQSIREIFNSAAYSSIREKAMQSGLPLKELCDKCELKRDGLWLTA